MVQLGGKHKKLAFNIKNCSCLMNLLSGMGVEHGHVDKR
jgi:hypothetical protein